MIPREIFDEAKRLASKATGIPVDHMLMSATPCPHCPNCDGRLPSDPDADYVKELPVLIARGVEKAHSNRTAAKIGWGVSREPNQLFNRRWKMKPGTIAADPFRRYDGSGEDETPADMAPGLIEPAGPTDPEVSVISVQTSDGQPLALLANYSLHYVGALSHCRPTTSAPSPNGSPSW